MVNENIIKTITGVINEAVKKPIQSPHHFMHPSRGNRVKDLTRFLWTTSCLLPAEDASCQEIAKEVIELVDISLRRGVFQLEKDCHLLSDLLLSLACWKIYPEALIEQIINQNFIECILKQQQTIRQSRLALFMVAAQVEAPHLGLNDAFLQNVAFGLPPFRVEKELMKRPHLARIAAAVDSSKVNLSFKDIKCGTTVPHLNIAGLTFNWER